MFKLPLRERGIMGWKLEQRVIFLWFKLLVSEIVAETGGFGRGNRRQSSGGSENINLPIERANPISTGTRHLHKSTEK